MQLEKLINVFTLHPKETNESYLRHLIFTVRMSIRFFYVSFLIIVHGLFPFLFARKASTEIEKIYGIMKTRVPKKDCGESDLLYMI